MDIETTRQRTEMFSNLCDWMWRNVVSPGWPEDGQLHTSDECRALASDAMEKLGLDRPTKDDLAVANPEWKERLVALGRWDDL